MTHSPLILDKTLSAWNTAEFEQCLKQEIESLPVDALPLQAGLTHGSYACDDRFSLILLAATDEQDAIRIRAGIHYHGIIAGCSCADDPTPNNETLEYCEVEILIDRPTAKSRITLLS